MAASSAVSSARSSAWSGRRSWTWRNDPPPTSRDRSGTRSSRRRSRARSSRCRGRPAARRAAAGRGASRAVAVDRQRPARGVAPDDDALGAADDLAVDRGSPAASARSSTPTSRARLARRRPGRRPIALEPAAEGRRAVDHGRRQSGRAPTGAPSSASSRRARARASTSGSRRGPVQAGQPMSQPHAAMRPAARRQQLGVAVPQPLGQADPARDRLVQVDGRLLRVGRADLGHEAEVARVDHQVDRGDGLDRPPRAEQRDVELVAAPVRSRTASAVSQ